MVRLALAYIRVPWGAHALSSTVNSQGRALSAATLVISVCCVRVASSKRREVLTVDLPLLPPTVWMNHRRSIFLSSI